MAEGPGGTDFPPIRSSTPAPSSSAFPVEDDDDHSLPSGHEDPSRQNSLSIRKVNLWMPRVNDSVFLSLHGASMQNPTDVSGFQKHQSGQVGGVLVVQHVINPLGLEIIDIAAR